MGMTDFSDQFRKVIIRYKRFGYNLIVIRQSACRVINPIAVDNVDVIHNCMPVDRASESMMTRPKAMHFSWLGPELSRPFSWSIGTQLMIFLCFRFQLVLFCSLGISNYHATRCIYSVLVFSSS